MFEPLQAAIAAQYVAFRSPRPRVVTGCPCCTTPAELAALVAAPREALAPGALERYAAKAMTTMGSVADFRYFWPRLAELAVEGRLLTSVETVFGKPAYGQHHIWPEEEREALRGLAAALGTWLAAEEVDADLVDTWACAIGRLSEGLDDPRRFLGPLLGDSPPARANLRALVEANEATARRKRRLTNAFWDSAPRGAALVLDWLLTEPRAVEAARALAAEAVERYGVVPRREPDDG